MIRSRIHIVYWTDIYYIYYYMVFLSSLFRCSDQVKNYKIYENISLIFFFESDYLLRGLVRAPGFSLQMIYASQQSIIFSLKVSQLHRYLIPIPSSSVIKKLYIFLLFCAFNRFRKNCHLI